MMSMMPWRLLTRRCSAPATSSSPSPSSSRSRLRVDSLQEAQHRGIGRRPIGHEQIGVLGCTHVTMEDHAEAADDHILQADRIRVGYSARQVSAGERVSGGEQLLIDTDEQRNRLLGELLPLFFLAKAPPPSLMRAVVLPLRG